MPGHRCERSLNQILTRSEAVAVDGCELTVHRWYQRKLIGHTTTLSCAEATAPRENKARGAPSVNRLDQRASNRSRSITLVQAAAKSSANFCLASSLAYTSASARSCEFDPKTRSTAVAVYFGSPVARSTPS